MSKEKLLEQLNLLFGYGNELRNTGRMSGYSGMTLYDAAKFRGWVSRIIAVFEANGIDSREKSVIDNEGGVDIYERNIQTVEEQLKSTIYCVENDLLTFDVKGHKSEELLENIFNKFHKVVRQLRTRHCGRETIKVTDEYDVQDLLHSLLLLHFDDVRTEEWTPSYAGGSVRMDFLLKQEKIVIEVKKTRETMTSKILGEELIIDKEKYANHQDCKTLYCFVYDPEGILGNPSGIKNDLESSNDLIKVFIRPE